MLPNHLIVGAYLLRGVLLWIVGRATITFFLILGGGSGLTIPFIMIVVFLAMIILLGWIDIGRQRERILLGNLGVHPIVVTGLIAFPAVVGEILLYSGAALFT
jgi:hypothetical protein